ncbi:hypothetical protein PVAND_003990 [Polypedilum vanderplanki]|uniref:Saccharopine dehydrogenase NADP binding domain-containing protein n=1 Tax=Polypedilum vanderplanki TaxID=319348 RepID=A0A9J6BWT4_POLVA|nr:hypothetical protein PVAND_003990 [Polypedilum vanderplanki]
MEKSFDIVIFGASGYTGKYAVREAVKILHNYKWAVAGRNKEKLQSVLKEVGLKNNVELSNVPIIIADINDDKSLRDMTAQAKVIVNCCGPYRFYGEQVVKACIETKTNHVDVSGEPQYMETMQLKYNDAAREKGVYIVSACGFDSIPADMGTVFLQKQFNGTVNSVETYLTFFADDGIKRSGASLHFGTFESAVYGFAHANELGAIRRQLFPTRLPRFQPTLKDRPIIHKEQTIGNRYCMAFPGSDRSVVMRSQRYFFEQENQRPIQMRAYISFDSVFAVAGVIFFGIIFGTLARFDFGRKLLLNYPKFFTFGAASHEGPTEEANEHSVMEMFFLGEGWKETLNEPTDQFIIPPNKKIVTKVSVKNPGYGATCDALLLSAVMILKESDEMPKDGGVFPPAAAFKNTNLINELQNIGYTFEVVKIEEK